MGMTGLLDLPVELLECILDYADPQDKRMFFYLSLVNKALNGLATPRLYHTVAFKDLSMIRPGIMLCRFIFSVLSSVERASMVREFYIVSEVPKEQAYFPAQTTADEITALLSEFPPDSLVRQVWETLAGLLLDSTFRDHRYVLLQVCAAVCLPNLRKLTFEGSMNQRMWDLMDAVLDSFGADRSSQSNMVLWPAFEEVAIQSVDQKYMDYSATIAIWVVRVPWLKRLYACGLGKLTSWDPPEDEFSRIEPRTSDIEALILQPRCGLHHQELDKVLRAPKALKVFKCNAEHGWAVHTAETSSLQASLDYQSQHLEEISLTLNYLLDMGSRYLRRDEMAPMTFAGYGALRVLEISLRFVFDQNALRFATDATGYAAAQAAARRRLVEMLPPSIEALRFAQCDSYYAAKTLNSALLELFARRAARFPRLAAVEIHAYAERANQVLPELRPSFAVAQAEGVRMVPFRGGLLGRDDVHDGWCTVGARGGGGGGGGRDKGCPPSREVENGWNRAGDDAFIFGK